MRPTGTQARFMFYPMDWRRSMSGCFGASVVSEMNFGSWYVLFSSLQRPPARCG